MVESAETGRSVRARGGTRVQAMADGQVPEPGDHGPKEKGPAPDHEPRQEVVG